MVKTKYWERAIILVDLDAFFASIEQKDFPYLKNKPVAVTNGVNGSCIITCSYEARSYGIKTGMRMQEALKLCPKLIKRPSRPSRYAEISSDIMASLISITPDVEIFSVDEAYLDITHCQLLHGSPVNIAKKVKDLIYQISGLTCSIGLSGDKTTAKYAAKLEKPNGLTIIHPSRSEYILSKALVTDLCGISNGIGSFLANHGVIYCGDMKKIPKLVLKKRFGPLGERIWYMAQGLDPSPVEQTNKLPQSVGHGKVIPPNINNKKIILNYFRHMSERVAARLRKYNLSAKKYYIALKLNSKLHNKISLKLSLAYHSNHGIDIYNLCIFIIENYWDGQVVSHVQVTALNPEPCNQQTDLFNNLDNKKNILNNIIDNINYKFGSNSLISAGLIEHNSSPDVIAPAWRPSGIRNSIDTNDKAK